METQTIEIKKINSLDEVKSLEQGDLVEIQLNNSKNTIEKIVLVNLDEEESSFYFLGKSPNGKRYGGCFQLSEIKEFLDGRIVCNPYCHGNVNPFFLGKYHIINDLISRLS